jgi:cysteine desulfurase
VRSGVGSYIGAPVHVAICRNPPLLSASDRLYLDHAATTPVLPHVREAMIRALDRAANPNSAHAEGRAARAQLEEARSAIAAALGWRHDVIFTSGASESVEIVARRARILGRAHGAIEHAIVPFAMGPTSEVIAVDSNGIIDAAALDAVLARGPALVAIQHVNNEIGVVQPLDVIAEKVRAAGSLLLVDCAQSAGKLPLPDADFVVVSGRKLGGPLSVGVLLVRELETLEPVGGHEKGYRRGTQDVASAVGLATALEGRPWDMERLATLRARLEDEVREAGGVIIAEGAPRIPTIGAIALPGVSSAALLVQLDLAGVAVSTGSACSSGKVQGSRVLAQMKVPEETAAGFIRVSFGPSTNEADIDRFLGEWRRIAGRAKAVAA